MKRYLEEIDSDDEEIIEREYKKRRLNTNLNFNKMFQEKYNISFDIGKIIGEYLDIPITEEIFCIYCLKLYLKADCQDCNFCDKQICEKCVSDHWGKVKNYYH